MTQTITFKPGDRISFNEGPTYTGTLIVQDVDNLWAVKTDQPFLGHSCHLQNGERALPPGSKDGWWVLESTMKHLEEVS